MLSYTWLWGVWSTTSLLQRSSLASKRGVLPSILCSWTFCKSFCPIDLECGVTDIATELSWCRSEAPVLLQVTISRTILYFWVSVASCLSSYSFQSDVYLGLHVYMGGVGFQQLFIFFFVYIAFKFQQEVRRERSGKTSRALLLLYIEYAVLILITVSPYSRLLLSRLE